jgi:hypothetical protein
MSLSDPLREFVEHLRRLSTLLRHAVGSDVGEFWTQDRAYIGQQLSEYRRHHDGARLARRRRIAQRVLAKDVKQLHEMVNERQIFNTPDMPGYGSDEDSAEGSHLRRPALGARKR